MYPRVVPMHHFALLEEYRGVEGIEEVQCFIDFTEKLVYLLVLLCCVNNQLLLHTSSIHTHTYIHIHTYIHYIIVPVHVLLMPIDVLLHGGLQACSSTRSL